MTSDQRYTPVQHCGCNGDHRRGIQPHALSNTVQSAQHCGCNGDRAWDTTTRTKRRSRSPLGREASHALPLHEQTVEIHL